MSWTQRWPDGRRRAVHIVPINDLQEHDDCSEQCWCAPRVERLESGVLVIHQSADGRELVEAHGLQ